MRASEFCEVSIQLYKFEFICIQKEFIRLEQVPNENVARKDFRKVTCMRFQYNKVYTKGQAHMSSLTQCRRVCRLA